MKKILFLLIIIIALTIYSTYYALSTENISLSQVRASFMGEDEWDVAGWSICTAGDVNGDGYDDIIIGSMHSLHDIRGLSQGETYFIFGKVSGWFFNTDLSATDVSYVGEENNDAFGICVSAAGDVNGDGYDDILIGAYYNDNGEHTNYNCGQVYLIFGRQSGWTAHTDLTDADASYVGMERDEWIGFTLSGAGDVNGDGYDDILIGAFAFGPNWPTAEERAGRVYLIFGKPSGWSMRTPLSEADVTFVGPLSKDWSGSTVAHAGDVNNDGYDDILIGAHWENKSGQDVSKAYLIFGKPEGWNVEIPMSDSDITFAGMGWFSESLHWEYWPGGWSVAGAGDVNGDSYDDMIFGMSWDAGGGDNAGQTYLIFGRPGGGGGAEVDLAAVADASFIGEEPGDWSGFRVTGGGDVNGDGYADILIAAYKKKSATGRTYLIFGKSDGWARGISLSEADVSFVGEQSGDRSGSSISISGDVNGDGYDDILIGAPYNDYAASDAGKTYLQCRQEQKGDVNFDGERDVIDVILTVNIILETLVEPPPGWLWAADYDDNGTVNMLDVVRLINVILEN